MKQRNLRFRIKVSRSTKSSEEIQLCGGTGSSIDWQSHQGVPRGVHTESKKSARDSEPQGSLRV